MAKRKCFLAWSKREIPIEQIRELFQRWRRRQREIGKKKQLCTWCSTLCNVKFPDRKFSFMEDVTTPWQIFLSPSKLWVLSQKFNSRKLTYIWRFQRVEIISIKKVWKTQRLFKCHVFRCDCLWRRWRSLTDPQNMPTEKSRNFLEKTTLYKLFQSWHHSWPFMFSQMINITQFGNYSGKHCFIMTYPRLKWMHFCK